MHGGSLTKSPSGTQHVRGLCSPRAARPLLTTRAVALGPGTETRQGDYGEITDLIASGVVAVWRKADAPPEALAGGARGSGHNITTARKHVEPDEIFVIGTSHLSEQSAAEVERLIRHVRPDNVVVELCRSRAGMMYREEGADEGGGGAFGISGEKPAQAMVRSLLLGGPSSFAIRVALARNTVLSSVLNRTGTDFRAARRTGEEVGATMVLGDRPIEITIERAWRALGWGDKRRFLGLLIKSLQTDQADLASQVAAVSEGGLEDGLLEKYESLLASEFPALAANEDPAGRAHQSEVEPLVRERDVFLSLTMKSSMAVNGCQRVVAVVGKGHVKGVLKALSENHSGKFKQLTWTPARAAAKEKVFGVVPKLLFDRVVVDSVILLAIVKAWEYFHPA
ncbi:TraB family-domain-containing protein [Baffinella frigidus]|nr:TraB family-domain-containing protein [Cryptophyta sp. CCMP2293]